jgi:predicted nucleic acid-binding protein
VISAVLDTNVLASGFVRHKEDSPPVVILDLWREDKYKLFVSEHILTELANTFDGGYFRLRLSQLECNASLVFFGKKRLLFRSQ